ncbi:MAG: 50S ribosomal protein L18, partial [Candidatus Krumholzibacteria bacterium]|nr:50S ribosomal protein L18 [Candidatus Krumholzibacteria bacterium]
RARRHKRIRKHLSGTEARPRLAVYRSLSNIYAQVIDDDARTTLASANSLKLEFSPAEGEGRKVAQARAVGRVIAEKAMARGVTEVAFDRGGFLFHGRVKALADAAREAGLKF